MSPSELPVTVVPKWLSRWPKDGTLAVALFRTRCVSAEPPNGKTAGHDINIGDRIVFVAGAWRCLPCARRIKGRDQ